MKDYLDFEKPILEIQERINQLKDLSKAQPRRGLEAEKLQKKMEEMQKDIFSKLTPWQVTQLARHPERPNTADYIRMVFEEFTELHGDRLFGDDKSILPASPAASAASARSSGGSDSSAAKAAPSWATHAPAPVSPNR